MIITVFLTATLSGCSSTVTNNTEKNQTVTPKKGAKTLEGFDKNVIQTKGKDKDQQEELDNFSSEMKHWKYGVDKPTTQTPSTPSAPAIPTVEGSNGDWNQPVSIELLSSDDMDNIINQLVAQGYLTQKTRNESEFKQALSAYQTDNNLQVTGELDRETLSLLFNNHKKAGSNN